jgi:hypothetical protein
MRPELRLAMWSGPRNISTALMRSWGNRPDTFVCDEPLYAHYLQQVDVPHPGREEVIRAGETDWRKVADWLIGPVPEGKSIFYQKHMAHHLLPTIERGWLDRLTHCFLIREPQEMLTSLICVFPEAGLLDTGLPQQVELFEQTAGRTGEAPPVIDSRDVLQDPRGTLALLCSAVGVPFLEEMLSWPQGPRATDGVWAKHWYGAVERTTGFQPYTPKEEPLPEGREALYEQCQELYQRLHRFRLSPNRSA